MVTTCPHCQAELSPGASPEATCPECGRPLQSGEADSTQPAGEAADFDATEMFQPDEQAERGDGSDDGMAPIFSQSAGAPDDPSLADTDAPADTHVPSELPERDMARVTRTWAQATTDHHDSAVTIKLPSPDVSRLETSLTLQKRAVRDPNEPEARVADYELLEVIGKGGMGVVYSARQASVDRTVALKMLRTEKAGAGTQRGKFVSEAVVTGDLDHPNIVPIYELGTNEQGALFYSMKRVQGTPWSEVIYEKSLAENLEILMKVADAIAFAHANGVVHCDLKPENVMLGSFGEVLVMDWGLAVVTAAFGHQEFVSRPEGIGGGTPAYMPPEMALGQADNIGYWSDIYLLGAILYEIIEHKRPHSGTDVRDCVRAAARNEIQPPEKRGELMGIALRAMATRRKDRFGSVQRFQSAIRQYQFHTESVVLANQAEEQLAEARKTDDYRDFARSMFGFEQALGLWKQNKDARNGLSAARLAYATSALEKQDFDLGLSLLEDGNPQHEALRDRLVQGQQTRDARLRRIAVLKWTTTGLAAAFLVVVTVAFFWIRAERDRAIVAREKAEIARDDAEQARSAAEEARDREKAQRALAEKAKQEAVEERLRAEEAEQEALAARDEEREAKEDALEARNAEEYQSYLAQIGLAAAKTQQNAFEDAYRLLDEYRDSHLGHLRHWEWGRLRYLAQRSLVTFDARAPVDAVAFSPDGSRFAAGTREGTVLLWARDQREPLLQLNHGARQYIQDVAYSPDGQWIATGASDGIVRIFRAGQQQPTRTWSGHSDSVVSVDFSPDSGWLATASYDQTVRIWNLADADDASARHLLRGHRRAVWSARFSPDGTRLVSAGEDGKVVVWRALDGDPSRGFDMDTEFRGHEGPVYAVAFSPDGRRVATGGYNNKVLVWDPDKVQPVDIEQQLRGETNGQSPFRTLSGHTAAVRSIDFSPDGELIVTCGDDNTARVWLAGSGRLEKTLRGHSGWVRACAFSPRSDAPEGPVVLTGSHDETLRLWSIPRYQEVRVLQGRVFSGHSDAILAAAFDSDGKRVVTASRDHTARIWDAQSGSLLHVLEEGHQFLASAGLFDPHTNRIVTSGIDGTVRFWDVDRGAEIMAIEGTGRTAAMAMSHDGRWILTANGKDPASETWIATLRKADSGKPIRSLKGHRQTVSAVAISPDNQWLVTADEIGDCRVWNAEDGSQLALWTRHSEGVTSVCFSPDGRYVLTASYDSTVNIHRLANGNTRYVGALEHPDSVTAMAPAANGRRLVTVCSDGLVRLWDLAERQMLSSMQAAGGPAVVAANVRRLMRRLDYSASDVAEKANIDRSAVMQILSGRTDARRQLENVAAALEVSAARLRRVSFSAVDVSSDNRHILLSNPEEKAVLVCPLVVGDASAGTEAFGDPRVLIDLRPRGASVWSAVYSPDDNRVLTVGGSDARLWDTSTGHEIESFSPHGPVAAVDFSPQGDLVGTAGWDGSVKVWDADTGQSQRRWSGKHDGPIYSLAFSPHNNEQVLTAGRDGRLLLWNVGTGEGREFVGHQGAVRQARFSQDGTRVVSASDDGTARIWDRASGRQLAVLEGHTGGVLYACFSSDRQRVITCGRDHTARIWYVDQQRDPIILRGHTAPVTCAAFSPDGRRVVTGSRDNTGKLWDTRRGTEVFNLEGHTQPLTSAEFSPDGQTILTSSLDGNAILWLADDWHGDQTPAP